MLRFLLMLWGLRVTSAPLARFRSLLVLWSGIRSNSATSSRDFFSKPSSQAALGPIFSSPRIAGLWLLVFLVLPWTPGWGPACGAAWAQPAEPLVCDGQIVPQDFVSFCAPQNSLNLPFWGMSSNGIQVISVAPEGTIASPGDLIAEFQFRGHEARVHIDKQYAQIRAKNQEAQLKRSKKVDQLEQGVRKSEILAQKAALDLQKGIALSKNRQKMLQCDAALLEFEAKALRARLKGDRDELTAQKAIADAQEKRVHDYYTIFDENLKRYKVIASDTGTIYYPLLDKENRKVRAGDKLNSGVHFLSLVRSPQRLLQFFLPERDLCRIKLGDRVTILREKDGDVSAVIRKIDFFPALVGDAQKNFRLPNSWDKCFLVHADLERDPGDLPFGSVKVRVKP
jgi:hypothetical protein